MSYNFYAKSFSWEHRLNRNLAIDLSRAIAVILVTLFHVWRDTGRPTFIIGDFDLFGMMGNGWVGVGMFFIISGYCMGISTERAFRHGVSPGNYTNYLFKRILRIAPPYYIAILAWYGFINLYGISVKPTSSFDVITHLTFSHNFFMPTFFSISGVFWTLAVEMQFYLILPVLIMLCKSRYAAMLLLLATLLLSIGINVSNLGFLYKWSLLNYLVLFVFGWILYREKESIVKIVNQFRLIWVALPLLILLMSYRGEGYDNNQKAFELIVSMVAGIVMMKLFSADLHLYKSNGISVLSFIGRASFSIYLYNYIYSAVKPINLNPVSSVLMFCGVMGFGILMYFLVEVNTEAIRKRVFSKAKANVS